MDTLEDPKLLKTQAYIAGEWVDAQDGAVIEVRNPANGELMAEVSSVVAEVSSVVVGRLMGANSCALAKMA